MEQRGNPYRPPADMTPAPIQLQPEWIEREIAANAQFNAGMVIIGIVYPVIGPASIYRGNRALALIKQHGVGMQHEGAAKRVRLFGIVLTLLWVGLVLLLPTVMRR